MTGAAKTKDHTDRSTSRRERIDTLLDEALKESFPASDAVSIAASVAGIKRSGVAPRSGKTGSGK